MERIKRIGLWAGTILSGLTGIVASQNPAVASVSGAFLLLSVVVLAAGSAGVLTELVAPIRSKRRVRLLARQAISRLGAEYLWHGPEEWAWQFVPSNDLDEWLRLWEARVISAFASDPTGRSYFEQSVDRVPSPRRVDSPSHRRLIAKLDRLQAMRRAYRSPNSSRMPQPRRPTPTDLQSHGATLIREITHLGRDSLSGTEFLAWTDAGNAWLKALQDAAPYPLRERNDDGSRYAEVLFPHWVASEGTQPLKRAELLIRDLPEAGRNAQARRTALAAEAVRQARDAIRSAAAHPLNASATLSAHLPVWAVNLETMANEIASDSLPPKRTREGLARQWETRWDADEHEPIPSQLDEVFAGSAGDLRDALALAGQRYAEL